MRPENLDRLLAVLGETHDSFLDKIVMEWDGSMSADLRLRILDMVRKLDESNLIALYHHITSTYGVEPDVRVQAPPHVTPVGKKARARRSDGTARKK